MIDSPNNKNLTKILSEKSAYKMGSFLFNEARLKNKE